LAVTGAITFAINKYHEREAKAQDTGEKLSRIKSSSYRRYAKAYVVLSMSAP